MARPQILPNTNRLVEMRESGMTQQEIADKVNEDNKRLGGLDYHPITRAAVSVALYRAGEMGGQRERYYDELPWSPINPEHAGDYRQTQLRTWARLNRDEPDIPDRALREFASFERHLREANAVIHYDPVKGFIAVRPRPGVDTGLIRLTDAQIAERQREDQ